jgi:iron complex outermembrane receptor protein
LSDSLLALGDRQAYRFNVVQQSHKQVSQAQSGLAWRGPVGSLKAEVGAYGIVRSMDNPIPPRIIDLDRLAGGLRGTLGSGQDVRTGQGGWLVGLDVELQRDDRLNFENDGGDRGEVTLDQLERVRSIGVFGQGGVRVGSRVSAVAALRYDRFRFQADDRMPERFPGQGLDDASGSRDMDALSPAGGISVDVGRDQTLFTNVSTVFGTPTTTELANQPDGSRGFNQDLEPQTGVTFEMGARGSVGRSAGYEVALFWTALENELIPFENESQPGRTFFKNAGSSRYSGFETSVFASFVNGLSGRLTYSYTDAEFDDYVVDGEDLAGNRIPGQAPHRVEALVRGERGRGFLELRYLYMDAIPVDDVNSESAPSYDIVDLRAGGRELSLGRMFISPFVGINNLLDVDYVASVVVNAFGGRYYEPGPLRTFYVGVTAGWPGL